jgi:hypothetical protein
MSRLTELRMLQIGDEVVVMSAPGRFRVVAVDGTVVTIENAEGVRKTVLERNVRVVQPRKPAA